jgi:hypothetical protein
MKNLLLFSLILFGLSFIFGCLGSSDQPIENPTANTPTANPTAPQSVATASDGKSKICHLDPDTGGSKVIIVNNSSLADHFAQGDCFSSLPKGTEGCSCAPSITSFTATPDTIDKAAGESSTLNWSTVNATNCSIDNGVGSVACNGNVNVSPTATVTYTLSASGAGGGPVTAQATVTVQYCHSISLAGPGGAAQCPTGTHKFCDSVPIVATSSSQSEAACNACFGANVCVAWNGCSQTGWQDTSFNTAYLYSGGGGATAGDIEYTPLCSPVQRWAP